MFRILRRNGRCEELPEASMAFLSDGQLLCYGTTGQLVAKFVASSIVAYGPGKSLESFTSTPKTKRRRSRAELLKLSEKVKEAERTKQEPR